MAKPTLRHRSVTAAATRAAARRAERARAGTDHTGRTGRTDRTRPRVPRPTRAEARRRGPGGKPGTGETPAAGRGRPLAALTLLVLTSLAASAVLGWNHRKAELARQARSEALAAAREAAPVILSYHHKRLDRDFAAAREHLTGSFRAEYEKTTTKVVAPTAEKYKGIVKATVAKPKGGGTPAASVVSSSPDRVVVLLFVNQVTESTQVSGGSRLDLNRVRMTLTRTPQGWKVSAVDAL